MARTVFHAEMDKLPEEQTVKTHNRWHPDLPFVETFKPGEQFRVECYDWTGGQIKNDDCADDIRDVDLSKVHYLSGPFGIEGAKPGDLLVVNINDIGSKEDSEWGFTGIFDYENGGGFLDRHFPRARKACWDFEGIYASSRHIPGVRFPGTIHPGLIGTLPSADLLKTWNDREKKLFDTNPTRTPPLCTLPDGMAGTTTALMGGMTGADAKLAGEEAARTVPGREHGGNCDIKNLSRGSKVFFPVYVDGAGLSMGDIHWSQGDGEITFCGAIEMAGWIDISVDIIKGGMEMYGVTNPIFQTSPIDANYSEYLVFEGISVDEHDGEQHYLDATVAYRRACLNAVEYLKKFGYSGEQAYMILGTAPVEGRVAGIVDIPNACCTVSIPTAIFDFDINPNATGPTQSIPVGVDVAECT
ncbi:MAG: acetamidase/formamidase family protein [Rhodospirillales bacterium]|jgi:formamidase|nr:acetamidase/formamidase family protein [Rhodospirillales bacterium]MBT5033870.1 acetamidase/formamidase family protein [Rhodospirillaceae bacterium]MBT8004924.1 acetamidase/formamidase family protein [Rhodospirillales bacterium]